MAKKYIPIEKMSVEDIKAELDKAFARWDQIHEHGCQDPSWEDGVNINLVRNHIIYYYSFLWDKLQESVQLTFFQDEAPANLRPVPPKMPNDWMCPTGDYPDRLVGRHPVVQS